MKTYTAPKKLADNPHYDEQKLESRTAVIDAEIDAPIIEIIQDFNKPPFCFTLQSCYGHFLYSGQDNPNNLEPLPDTKTITRVEYRIAYIAFCLENSDSGRSLLKALKEIPAIDPEYIQFCSAEWFWDKQVNSYALQVEPDRFKHEDTATIDGEEALYIEKIRNEFFVGIMKLFRS